MNNFMQYGINQHRCKRLEMNRGNTQYPKITGNLDTYYFGGENAACLVVDCRSGSSSHFFEAENFVVASNCTLFNFELAFMLVL